MALDFTPGRIGLSTATKLGIARHIDKMLTQTIAKKEDGSNFSSSTIKTIPAEESPRVRSKTVRLTTACFKETHPQQHDVALLKKLRNFDSLPAF